MKRLLGALVILIFLAQALVATPWWQNNAPTARQQLHMFARRGLEATRANLQHLAVLIPSLWKSEPMEQTVDSEKKNIPPVIKPEPLHYYLSARYDPDRGIISGRVQVRWPGRQAGEQQLTLLLPANSLSTSRQLMQVREVKVKGDPVSVATNGPLATFKLADRLSPRQWIPLEIQYETEVPIGNWLLGRTASVVTAVAWYPTLITPLSGVHLEGFGDPYWLEAAHYTLDLTLPAGWAVVASTPPIKHRQNGAEQVLLYETRFPARELAWVAGPELRQQQRRVGGIDLIYAHLGKGRTSVLDTATKAAALFEQLFGPYPGQQLVLVEAPLDGQAGMEFSGLMLLRVPAAEQTIVHELAHQWWYGLVGNNQFKEPWIDEGLAVYASALYLETYQGKGAYRSMIDDFSKKARAPLNSIYAANNEEYRQAAYMGGAMFWHNLRQEAGLEGLIRVWHRLQQQYRHQMVNTSQVLTVIQEETGVNQTLLRSWLENGDVRSEVRSAKS